MNYHHLLLFTSMSRYDCRISSCSLAAVVGAAGAVVADIFLIRLDDEMG